MQSEPSRDCLPPHSVESEMCYLCALVLSAAHSERSILLQLRRAVHAGDFFQPDHQIIFECIARLIDRGQTPDWMVIREELIRMKVLDDVGGIEHIAAIASAAPSYTNGEGYAAIVREKSSWRRVISVCSEAIRRAGLPAKEDRSIDAARDAANALALLAISQTRDTVARLGDGALKVLDRRNAPRVRRIGTGLVSLDLIIAGLPKSKIVLVGADARVGKSALIKQILNNQARAGTRVGLVTIEEDLEKVAENQLAGAGMVPNYIIARGDLTPAEWSQVDDAAVKIANLDFFIDDQPLTLDQVVASIERLAMKYKCEVIAVDHLHLIQCRGETREQEISRISATLKATFKRLNVAGIVAVQLNRDQKNIQEKPTIRSMRGSGSLEADGDIILLLWREDVLRYNERGYCPTRTLEVAVAKNKDGRMGAVPLHFDGDHQTISDIKGAPIDDDVP